MAETYDPSAYTVDEVNTYLDENPDQVETVLAAEGGADEPRKGIIYGRHGTPEPSEDGTNTGGQTVAEAGANATEPEGEGYRKGYHGFVPSRDGDNPQDLTLAGVTGQNQES